MAGSQNSPYHFSSFLRGVQEQPWGGTSKWPPVSSSHAIYSMRYVRTPVYPEESSSHVDLCFGRTRSSHAIYSMRYVRTLVYPEESSSHVDLCFGRARSSHAIYSMRYVSSKKKQIKTKRNKGKQIKTNKNKEKQ